MDQKDETFLSDFQTLCISPYSLHNKELVLILARISLMNTKGLHIDSWGITLIQM